MPLLRAGARGGAEGDRDGARGGEPVARRLHERRGQDGFNDAGGGRAAARRDDIDELRGAGGLGAADGERALDGECARYGERARDRECAGARSLDDGERDAQRLDDEHGKDAGPDNDEADSGARLWGAEAAQALPGRLRRAAETRWYALISHAIGGGDPRLSEGEAEGGSRPFHKEARSAPRRRGSAGGRPAWSPCKCGASPANRRRQR